MVFPVLETPETRGRIVEARWRGQERWGGIAGACPARSVAGSGPCRAGNAFDASLIENGDWIPGWLGRADLLLDAGVVSAADLWIARVRRAGGRVIRRLEEFGRDEPPAWFETLCSWLIGDAAGEPPRSFLDPEPPEAVRRIRTATRETTADVGATFGARQVDFDSSVRPAALCRPCASRLNRPCEELHP